MQITAADGIPPGSKIDVSVEHDDGCVSYATYRNGFRCFASPPSTRIYWEVRSTEGNWIESAEHDIELSLELRRAMARAANAGLVAGGMTRSCP